VLSANNMERNAGRRTVVSLTPLSLDADSRTYRIARSLGEAGLRSVVLEGEPSACRFWGSDIDVISLGSRGTDRASSLSSGSATRRTIAGLRAGRLGAGGELVLYLGFRGYEWWRHYRRMLGRIPAADLYYLHSFEFHRAVAPIAARKGARIIYDAHDFYRGIEPPELQSAFDRERLRPFFNSLEDRLAAVANATVTVSEGVAALMEQTFGRRPTVIRNCHDARLDQAVEPDLRQFLSLSPSDRLCVVVGNRKRGMALDTAVAAIASLPDQFHLAFLGRGYEADRERIGHHPAASRVHFVRHVAPNRVVPFIRSADLGLIIYEPYSDNYRYALPNGFFQLIAAGLPLVRGALPEIEATIGQRDIGVRFYRLEPAALAASISYCAEHTPRLRSSTGMLARELRWQTEASRLEQLVQDVLAAPLPRRRQAAAIASLASG
jgi:glycosyltransferase involved in cell wall biosynthesis